MRATLCAREGCGRALTTRQWYRGGRYCSPGCAALASRGVRHVYRRKAGEPTPPPATRRRCACGRAVTSASNRRCRVCLTEAALQTWRYVESAE